MRVAIGVVECLQKRLIAHPRPQRLRIGENALPLVETRRRRGGMPCGDILGVTAEQRRFQRLCALQVIRNDQKFFIPRPGVVFGHHRRQFGFAASGRVVAQQQRQHGHEMAFAGTEAAVQIGALAGAGVEGAFDHAKGLIETLEQLRGDDVLADGFRRDVEAIREFQHEIARADVFRQVENVAEGGHGVVFL